MSTTVKGQAHLESLRRAIAADLLEKEKVLSFGFDVVKSLPAPQRLELLALAERRRRAEYAMGKRQHHT